MMGSEIMKGEMMRRRRQTLNRREFFSRAILGAASAGFMALPASLAGFGRNVSTVSTKANNLITRRLGKTGTELPIVNMGVMNTLNPDLIRRSYALGVRHFDTAAYYMRGQNEIMVGKVLKELGVRDDVVIGTKVFVPHEQRPRLSPEELKKIFLQTAEDSLKRLQTDVIDIFYVHNVQDAEFLHNPGIQEAMSQLKAQKKVRHSGFSVHSNMAELVHEAVKKEFYEVVEVAFNYSMADDKALLESLKSAHSQGIGLIAMKTQCTQYWYRDYVPSEKQEYYQGEVIHTAVLKWVLRHDFITCAIPGYTTFEQMETDIPVAYDLEYTPQEREFLEDRAVKITLNNYCRQCYCCISTCPRGVDIPALMRTHLYALGYGNFIQARDTLDEIVRGKGLEACHSCQTCRARCERGVPILGRIGELKSLSV